MTNILWTVAQQLISPSARPVSSWLALHATLRTTYQHIAANTPSISSMASPWRRYLTKTSNGRMSPSFQIRRPPARSHKCRSATIASQRLLPYTPSRWVIHSALAHEEVPYLARAHYSRRFPQASRPLIGRAHRYWPKRIKG